MPKSAPFSFFNMKKGQIGSLQTVVITILVVGLLIGAGFLLIEEIRDQDRLFESNSFTNETTGGINATGYTVDGASDDGSKSFSLTNAWFNDTNPTQIPLANLTISSQGVVTNATVTTYDNTANVSYNYERGTQGWKGIDTSLDAFMTLPNLLGLILLIVVIGIVLAIVFRVIPGAGETTGA